VELYGIRTVDGVRAYVPWDQFFFDFGLFLFALQSADGTWSSGLNLVTS
jgi:hypothetical protein